MASLTFVFMLETIETFEMEKKIIINLYIIRQLYYDQILMFYERLMLYWQ